VSRVSGRKLSLFFLLGSLRILHCVEWSVEWSVECGVWNVDCHLLKMSEDLPFGAILAAVTTCPVVSPPSWGLLPEFWPSGPSILNPFPPSLPSFAALYLHGNGIWRHAEDSGSCNPSPSSLVLLPSLCASCETLTHGVLLGGSRRKRQREFRFSSSPEVLGASGR